MAGAFVWFDLMSTDLSAAKAFYGAVVGWQIVPFEGTEEAYDMFAGARGPIGGCEALPEMARERGVAQHWLGYVDVHDLDASCARVQELGGELLQRRAIPGVGELAVFRDPAGAVSALFCSTNPGESSPKGRPQAGEVSWCEHASADMDAAWAFYSELFGWTVSQDMDMGPGGTYRIYDDGTPRQQGAGGFYVKPPEMPYSAWTFYFTVPDLEAALERVRAHGGQVLNGPMEVPGGDRVAQCLDPQGGGFALHVFAG